MPGQKHIIHRQVIEVEVPSVEGAWTLQNRISDTYKYNLLHVLEEIFDSIAPPGEVLRIDRLEIDLGNMKAESLEEEIAAKIREKLSEKLVKIRQEAEGNSGAADAEEQVSFRKRPAVYSATDFLIHFLRTGNVPWWHDRSEFGSAREILVRFIHEKQDWIRRCFPQLLREVPVRRRLIAVFENSILVPLLSLLDKNSAAVLARILHLADERRIVFRRKDFTAAGTKERVANAIPLSAEEARAELLLAAFESVAAATLSVFTRQAASLVFVIPEAVGKKQSLLPEEVRRLLGQTGLAEEEIAVIGSDERIVPVKKRRSKTRRKRTKENLRSEWVEEEITSEDADEFSETSSGFEWDLHPDEEQLTGEEPGNDLSGDESEPGKTKKKSAGKKKLRRKKKDEQLPGELTEEFLEAISAETDIYAEETVAYEMIDETDEQAVAKAKNPESGIARQEVPEEFPEEMLPPPEDLTDFIIDNAGLVLVWPYLVPFFDALGLLENRKFINDASRSRAIHLLQYIADNGEFEYEEYDLVLNKILLGMEPADPVDMQFSITENEKEEIDGLLKAVAKNWAAIGSISTPGFRSSFLRREGSLKKTEQGWILKIERTGYDILLDKLPWSIALIRTSWASEMLHVEW